MAGVWMDGFSFDIYDHFRILIGLFTCPGWWNILLIERYLAAKIETVYLDLVGWVLCISVIEVVFHFSSAGIFF